MTCSEKEEEEEARNSRLEEDGGPVEPVAVWKPEEPLTPVPGYSPPAVSSAASSVPPSLFDFHRKESDQSSPDASVG